MTVDPRRKESKTFYLSFNFKNNACIICGYVVMFLTSVEDLHPDFSVDLAS